MRYMSLRQIICITLALLLFPTGCSENDDNLDLRSSENETYYWANNKLASLRLATIMHNTSDSLQPYERFKVVHISDSHVSHWSLSNNSKLPFNLRQSIKFANQQELMINAIVATGDFISNGKKNDAMDYLQSFINNFYRENHIPSFLCTGNHDSNAIDQIEDAFIYKNEINRILFSRQNYQSNKYADESYYYSDVPNPQGGMVRIISLDMLDQPGSEYNTLYYAIFSQKQVDWLANVALKERMTDKHSVIILTHYPFQRRDAQAYTYLSDGDFVHSWAMIPEIVEAFRKRSSLSKTYPNKVNSANTITVNADFSNSVGEFVCYMGGHAHCNAEFNVMGLANESKTLPKQKMILCTNQAPSEMGTVYNRVIRKEDSESSNSFCIYAIDTKEKKVYITYFGAYKPSNNANYPEIRSISYL